MKFRHGFNFALQHNAHQSRSYKNSKDIKLVDFQQLFITTALSHCLKLSFIVGIDL